MKMTCDACHTNYEVPDELGANASCPCCEHVNRPRGRVEAIVPTTLSPEATAQGEDAPIRTMLFPSDGELRDTGITDVQRLRSTNRPGLTGSALGLIVTEQGKPPRHHPIKKARLVIGRGRCDIRVHDPEASREHCAIEVYDGVPILKDLQSANGTVLNGHLVREHVLHDGDQIRLGTTVVEFKVNAAGKGATAA